MEKVKLTKEQAEAVEEVKMNLSKSSAVEFHVDGWIDSHLECLNELSTDEFVRTLYVGYEVIPNLKDGDLIYHTFSNAFGEVKGDVIYWDDGIENDLEAVKNMFQYNAVRHATPEEIEQVQERKFINKIKGLQKGSLISWNNQRIYEFLEYDVNKTYPIRVRNYLTKELDGLTPISNIEIICFAEDRKDLD